MSGPSRFFDDAKPVAAAGFGRRRLIALASAGALMCTIGLDARAQSPVRLLDAPRAAGTVGERYDGFAAVRGAAPPDIVALVDAVNAERRTIYAQRAAAEQVPIEAVGKIYAAEIIKSAPPGLWFLSETGQWTRK